MRRCFPFAAALVASSLAAIAAPPSLQTLGIDNATIEQFYQQIVNAVRKEDIDAVAALVRYPLYYGSDSNRAGGAPSSIVDAAAMRTRYHDIFTATIKRVIACRTPADFSTVRDGIVIGDGSLWLVPSRSDTGEVARPLAGGVDGGVWQLRIAAVYDGVHARRDAERCEAQKQ